MAEGKIVLSDRYVISSLVYQALELPIDWVRSLNQHAPEPDLTLLVDLEVSEAEARRSKRGGPEEISTQTKRSYVYATHISIALKITRIHRLFLATVP